MMMNFLDFGYDQTTLSLCGSLLQYFVVFLFDCHQDSFFFLSNLKGIC